MKTVNWKNPYANMKGAWLKGNLHTHTSPASQCSKIPLAESLALYSRKGYDFLSVSDHMTVSVCDHKRMTLIPGLEWNSEGGGEHVGLYSPDQGELAGAAGITDQKKLLRYMGLKKNSLVIMNHPNWGVDEHYERKTLLSRKPYHGVEIYNAVIERLSGTALATDKWDVLLSRGVRCLGFASDDSHTEGDIGNAWICVRAVIKTPQVIFDSIMEGNFYCSSGVVINDISMKGSIICIETRNAQEIHAVGINGRVLARTSEKKMKFDITGTEDYVRFTAFGKGSTMAWTQPFFVK